MLASIPSPSVNTVELGPLEIHVYGILIAAGIAIALTLVRRRWAARGGDPDVVDQVLVWAVVLGFLGARFAYVSTHLDRFTDRPLAVLFIWEGGLALFGGLTVGTLAALVLLRRLDVDVPRFADATAVGIPLAQSIGRWGNYFNQELFGTPTDLPWGLEIDPRNRPEAYPSAETFHPAFLYESVYNALVVGALLLIERRFRLRPGNLMLAYVVLYGIGRFLLELIRTDTTFRVLGLSRNAWVALLYTLVAAVWFVHRQRRFDPQGDGPAEAAIDADGTAPTDH